MIRPMGRQIFIQGQMRSELVEKAGVGRKDSVRMPPPDGIELCHANDVALPARGEGIHPSGFYGDAHAGPATGNAPGRDRLPTSACCHCPLALSAYNFFLMAIWEKGTETIVCRHCGAAHEADYREYLLSEVGSQNCLECGKELISWSGTRAYIVFRLEKR